MRLAFPTKVRRPDSLRDVFVRALRHPLESLSQSTTYLEVIRDLSLTVRRGDRIALMGVNGAGKTTLCRTIAGFYQASGKIEIRGEVRAIFDTMVGIYPELTGRENAEILVNFLYPNIDKKGEKIQKALVFSELGAFLDTPFKYYSNGMQTRLCLSVLTIEPTDLLILDEVFEGADRFFKEKIAQRVLDIIHRSGAVIFVSHNEDQISRVCNRAVVLHKGTIAFDGSVDAAVQHYHNIHGPNEYTRPFEAT